MDAAARHELAMLTMLLAMCEQALTVFDAAGSRVDAALVTQLEAVVERVRHEIGALSEGAQLL